jgi:hypothetical protein
MGSLFCVLGFYRFVSSVPNLYHAYCLNNFGAVASGKVENLYLTHGKGGPSYHITYSYVGGNTAETTNSTISQKAWASVQIGGDVPVVYLPDAPAISEPDIAGERDYAINHGWMDTLFSLVFVAVGFYAVFFSQNFNRRARDF